MLESLQAEKYNISLGLSLWMGSHLSLAGAEGVISSNVADLNKVRQYVSTTINPLMSTSERISIGTHIFGPSQRLGMLRTLGALRYLSHLGVASYTAYRLGKRHSEINNLKSYGLLYVKPNKSVHRFSVGNPASISHLLSNSRFQDARFALLANKPKAPLVLNGSNFMVLDTMLEKFGSVVESHDESSNIFFEVSSLREKVSNDTGSLIDVDYDQIADIENYNAAMKIVSKCNELNLSNVSVTQVMKSSLFDDVLTAKNKRDAVERPFLWSPQPLKGVAKLDEMLSVIDLRYLVLKEVLAILSMTQSGSLEGQNESASSDLAQESNILEDTKNKVSVVVNNSIDAIDSLGSSIRKFLVGDTSDEKGNSSRLLRSLYLTTTETWLSLSNELHTMKHSLLSNSVGKITYWSYSFNKWSQKFVTVNVDVVGRSTKPTYLFIDNDLGCDSIGQYLKNKLAVASSGSVVIVSNEISSWKYHKRVDSSYVVVKRCISLDDVDVEEVSEMMRRGYRVIVIVESRGSSSTWIDNVPVIVIEDIIEDVFENEQ